MNERLYNMRIAAIVPVYNVEAYLSQCINSLLEQTVAFDRIVLVDDGSLDASGAICDFYASKYPNVECIHKQNEGLGFARNSGLDVLESNIDYVMFVDSDDWLETDALEHLLSKAVECNADCVIGGHTKKDSGEKTRFIQKLENRVYEGNSIREELIPRLCGSAPGASDSIPMSAWGSLFRLDVIQEHTLRFPSEREMISEDFVFKFNFLQYAKCVATSDFTQYCYRTNDTSLSRSYRPDRFNASVRFYREVLKMIQGDNLPNECIARLRKTLFIYLRTCIKQERKAVSGKGFCEAKRFITNALSDSTVREAVSQYSPTQLRWRQRLFFELIRFRLSGALLLLADFGLL